jgi:hypothetical protein
MNTDTDKAREISDALAIDALVDGEPEPRIPGAEFWADAYGDYLLPIDADLNESLRHQIYSVMLWLDGWTQREGTNNSKLLDATYIAARLQEIGDIVIKTVIANGLKREDMKP